MDLVILLAFMFKKSFEKLKTFHYLIIIKVKLQAYGFQSTMAICILCCIYVFVKMLCSEVYCVCFSCSNRTST